MKRSLTLALAVLVIMCAAPVVLAQTGPTGPPAATLPGTSPPTQQAKLTPERLAALLRADGHQVEIKKLGDGGQLVIATVLRDGWRFVVEFEFNPAGTNMNVICSLGTPASQFSSAQLLQLMKKSYELICPLHFSYRASDQRLCLEDPCYTTVNFTDAGVRSILDRVVKTVRDTHDLWDTSRWPISGSVGSVGAPGN
jgi:hypothetical protein